MTDQDPQKIKVQMILEGSYELMNEELRELLNDFKELAEHRGFRLLDDE